MTSPAPVPDGAPVALPARVLQPPADAAEPRRKRAYRAADVGAGYAFLSPWIIGFAVLTAFPMFYSLYLAFTDFHIIRGGEFVGLENFQRMFSDPRYLQSVGITTVYVLVGTPVKLAAALGVALFLNQRLRGVGFYRSVFYVPSLIGASVSIAIVWKALFVDEGIVDTIQQLFGAPAGGWVGRPDMTMPMMILLTTWQFGAPMVIFLAGLKQVPAELYEAAQVDGAGPVRRFLSITLPMLSPVLFFNLLLETIHAFQVFSSAYIISNGTGGPAGSTNFYTLYLYTQGFVNSKLGYAAAMAWVLVLVVGLITAVLFRTSKAWVHYSGDER